MKKEKRNLHARSSVVLVLLLIFTSTSLAQDLRYKTTTTTKLEGMGIIGRAIGNVSVEEEVFLKGQQKLVRTDDNTDTVTDLINDRMVYINKEKEQYSIVTFDQMAEAMGNMMEQGAENMEEAQQQAEEETGTSVEDYEFDFSADATGKKEKINGYEAEQMLMTIKVGFSVESEDEEGDTESMRGNFYALVDSWLSDDIPNYDQVKAFDEAYAEKLGEAMGSSGSGNSMESMQTVFQQDERMKVAMEKVAEEMAKVEGAPVRTTVFYILAPEEAELNVDKALGLEEQPRRRRGLGGLARGVLRNSGIPMGGDEDTGNEGEITEQKTLFSTTTVLSDVESANLDAGLFEPNTEFEEVEWPGFGGM